MSITAFGVPGVWHTTTTILSVTSRRYGIFVWKFRTIAHHYYYWFSPRSPAAHTLGLVPRGLPPPTGCMPSGRRDGVGARINFPEALLARTRMTHWEIGKHPTSIIKTKVHYTYLIRCARAHESTVSSRLCAYNVRGGSNHSHPKRERTCSQGIQIATGV